MDIIPTEIYITILSYLDINTEVENISISELETSRVLEAFPRELSQKDWVQLFTLRFPRLFHKSLYQYDVPSIYLELLFLGPNVYTIEFSIHSLVEIRNALKYLMMNQFIEAEAYIIAEFDDTDLLFIKHLEQDPSGKIILTEYFSGDISNELIPFIYNNSVNILEYLFSNSVFVSEEDNELIIESIVETYTDVSDINLETTKILFKYFKLGFQDLITILLNYDSKSRESYDYIFSILPEVPESVIGELLANYSQNDYIRYDTFIPIWNKYKDQLGKNDIIAIYHNMIYYIKPGGKRDELNIFSIITEIAQHPVIREKYLRLNK